jgi:putative ABC transport system permease protein
MPASMLPFFVGRMNFVTKTAGDPLALKEAARRALHAIDPNAAVSLRSFDEVVAWATAPRVFNLHLLGFFSAAAVLLAALGLYAITAQAVAARTREIGIRMALGADRLRIARQILDDGSRVVLAGMVGGLALAALFTPLLTRMLFSVGSFDPLTYGAAIILLTAVALLATWLPARRAMRVDPIIALRAE